MIPISLCITTYNRLEFTIESFKQVLQDDRISEIILSDDCSELVIFEKLKTFCEGIPKVKLSRNLLQQGCYQNKMIAVSLASNPWVIIFDSDNVIDSSYIDALEKTGDLDPRTVYHPDFAMPHFNFSHFGGHTITKHNVKFYVDQYMGGTIFNAMNYVVNRDEYLKVFDRTYSEPWAADSIIQNYNWLNAGNSIFVVPFMRYCHQIHDGSHFKIHQHKSLKLAHEYEEKLKQLK